MKTEFDGDRLIRAVDKLFRENEELKARISILEKIISRLDETKDGQNEEKRIYSNTR